MMMIFNNVFFLSAVLIKQASSRAEVGMLYLKKTDNKYLGSICQAFLVPTIQLCFL